MNNFFKFCGFVIALTIVTTGAGVVFAGDEDRQSVKAELALAHLFVQVGEAACNGKEIDELLIATIAKATAVIEKSKTSKQGDFTVELTIERKLVVNCENGTEVVINFDPDRLKEPGE
jgi:hypothetical protein